MATKKLPKRTPPVVYLSRRRDGDYVLARGPGLVDINAELDLCHAERDALGYDYDMDGTLTPEYDAILRQEDRVWEEYEKLHITSLCAKQFHKTTGVRLRKGAGDVAVTIHFKLA